ncbi:MAG: hypothetical protein ABSB19_01285 [Methylomonas sp.]|jgi:hypothetical protein
MPDKIAKLILLFLILYACKSVFAEEAIEIKFEALPDAVQKTALGSIERKRIGKITKISENENVKYKIETDKLENKKDLVFQIIVIANNGKIMKFTKEVPYFTLSFEQMQAIEKQYPGIKVNELESVEIHYFDVLAEVKGQEIKFRFFENGAMEEIPSARK